MPKENRTELDIASYMGDNSYPWQFSVTRSTNEIVITQARGPEDKFDPVIKQFEIKDSPIDDEPQSFQHTVIRRVWTEDPNEPNVRSQRSEGRIVETLLHDKRGWHLDRPEPRSPIESSDWETTYYQTNYPGITVSDGTIRSQTEDELQFTEERNYRISKELFETYDSGYVLSYHEVNEESRSCGMWETANATAYRLL
ncbi:MULTISPECIES: hypothetical protein [Haloferax]|uniref:Uncharacterized protein n=2 Tax=Haloferax TaxID=2251 RepID=A0A6G1Z811_9EURY|nr:MULTISPECIES: hypothetical protein [Haloferax]KAB1184822.1 hypothetical protein Hfx1149_17315 [Haloferax sp. CBA1149]MRW82454.1 hypothetical protein [Haloferax marinisediminis]